MYVFNIDINFKSNETFVNIVAAINAMVLFIVTIQIPLVYGIFNQLEFPPLMSVMTYVFMIFIRLFSMSQLFLAVMAIISRFRLFNEIFSQNILLNHLGPLCVHESVLKHYGSIFHKLCDGIEVINQSLTFQFILLLPHILVT